MDRRKPTVGCLRLLHSSVYIQKISFHILKTLNIFILINLEEHCGANTKWKPREGHFPPYFTLEAYISHTKSRELL